MNQALGAPGSQSRAGMGDRETQSQGQEGGFLDRRGRAHLEAEGKEASEGEIAHQDGETPPGGGEMGPS